MASAFATGAVVAVARFGEVLAAPAVGAELVFGQANGVNHVVDALERKRREVQLLDRKSTRLNSSH